MSKNILSKLGELIEKWLKIFSQTLEANLWEKFEQIYKEECNEL